MTEYYRFCGFLIFFEDSMALHNFFKGWLKDMGTDTEHLKLIWSNSGML